MKFIHLNLCSLMNCACKEEMLLTRKCLYYPSGPLGWWVHQLWSPVHVCGLVMVKYIV